MRDNFFVSIDFDGTITDTDITDAIIKEFARPEWEEAEELWEEGKIGSRECLARQMSLIDVPLEDLLSYTQNFSVHESFIPFIEFLRASNIPHAIISDGFEIFIKQILSDAGIEGVPVYANKLAYENGALKTFFPNTNTACTSGTCKCKAAEKAGRRLPVIHVGDGRSDFCIARKAAYVFTRRKLTSYCKENDLAHAPFEYFSSIEKNLRLLTVPARTPHPSSYRGQDIAASLAWNPAT